MGDEKARYSEDANVPPEREHDTHVSEEPTEVSTPAGGTAAAPSTPSPSDAEPKVEVLPDGSVLVKARPEDFLHPEAFDELLVVMEAKRRSRARSAK